MICIKPSCMRQWMDAGVGGVRVLTGINNHGNSAGHSTWSNLIWPHIEYRSILGPRERGIQSKKGAFVSVLTVPQILILAHSTIIYCRTQGHDATSNMIAHPICDFPKDPSNFTSPTQSLSTVASARATRQWNDDPSSDRVVGQLFQ